MKLRQTSLWLIGIGIVLLAFSFLWPKLVGGRISYTEEDAAEYLRASTELHNRLHRHGAQHSHSDAQDGDSDGKKVSDGELQAAWDDYNQAVAKRDAEISRGQTTAWFAKWLGRFTTVIGLAIYFIAQPQD